MRDRPAVLPGVLASSISAVWSLACAPTVNLAGVYFPGWLISAGAGVVVAYLVVSMLARRVGARELAQSGLLFCGLTVSIGLSVWWIFFGWF